MNDKVLTHRRSFLNFYEITVQQQRLYVQCCSWCTMVLIDDFFSKAPETLNANVVENPVAIQVS